MTTQPVDAVLRYDRYDWSGGSESLLRFGPDTGPVVIAALPLFEEANRTRAFTVAILRALATRGIASVLPDFPGTGDSVADTGDATLGTMRDAYRALATHLACDRMVYGVGLRSGALLDTHASLVARWNLAPQAGVDVLRDLRRAQSAGTSMDYAGNILSDVMVAELETAAFATRSARTVRLETDPRAADLKLAGRTLWRRAEPGNDITLAERLAADIADWVRSCAV